jgi:phenylpyruvate tautomerase PptA (4-oxalocrotonate tautomerase family)
VAIVTVEIFRRSQEVRDRIVEGITEVMVANGARAEGTEVVIVEIDPSCWGQGGLTFAERRRRREAAEAAGETPAPG